MGPGSGKSQQDQRLSDELAPIAVSVVREVLPQYLLDGADGALHLPVGLAVADCYRDLLDAPFGCLLLEVAEPFCAIVAPDEDRFAPAADDVFVEPARGGEGVLGGDWAGFNPLGVRVNCHSKVSISLVVGWEGASEINGPALTRSGCGAGLARWFSRRLG